jgi:hypothetical protein
VLSAKAGAARAARATMAEVEYFIMIDGKRVDYVDKNCRPAFQMNVIKASEYRKTSVVP